MCQAFTSPHAFTPFSSRIGPRRRGFRNRLSFTMSSGWLVCVGTKEVQGSRRIELKEGVEGFSIGRRESCNLRCARRAESYTATASLHSLRTDFSPARLC